MPCKSVAPSCSTGLLLMLFLFNYANKNPIFRLPTTIKSDTVVAFRYDPAGVRYKSKTCCLSGLRYLREDRDVRAV